MEYFFVGSTSEYLFETLVYMDGFDPTRLAWAWYSFADSDLLRFHWTRFQVEFVCILNIKWDVS